jgi:uncharacterized membrane protein
MRSISTIKLEAKAHMSGRFMDILKAFWPTVLVSIMSFGYGLHSGIGQANTAQQMQDGVTYGTQYSANYAGPLTWSLLGMVVLFAAIPVARKMYRDRNYNQEATREFTSQRAFEAIATYAMTTIAALVLGLAIGFVVGFAAFFVGLIMAGSSGAALLLLLAALVIILPLILYVMIPFEIVPYVVSDYDAGINAPADWESYGAWAKATTALKYAWGAAKGKRLDYFLFQLSFMGWWFAAVFTFGLALIYVAPYMTLATYGYMKDRFLPDAPVYAGSTEQVFKPQQLQS